MIIRYTGTKNYNLYIIYVDVDQRRSSGSPSAASVLVWRSTGVAGWLAGKVEYHQSIHLSRNVGYDFIAVALVGDNK